MEEIKRVGQTLLLENRTRLTVDTVKSIEGFNEDFLEISTELGVICIEGAELKIEHLTSENGKIRINGQISGIFFREEKPAKRLFKNIFK